MTTDEANHIIHHYYYDVLKFCGCGEPANILDELKDALERIASFTRTRDNKQQFEEALKPHLEWFNAHQFLVYTLGTLDLTEHGFNISGGWLTPKGEQLLEVLCTYDEDWENSGHIWYANQAQEAREHEAAFRQEWGGR